MTGHDACFSKSGRRVRVLYLFGHFFFSTSDKLVVYRCFSRRKVAGVQLSAPAGTFDFLQVLKYPKIKFPQKIRGKRNLFWVNWVVRQHLFTPSLQAREDERWTHFPGTSHLVLFPI